MQVNHSDVKARERRNIVGQLKGKNTPIDCPITKIDKISHDSYVYYCQLPDPTLPLGIDVGGHVFIEAHLPTKENPQGERVRRKYTPISPIDQKGSFDMLVKVYRKGTHPDYPEGGVLTQHLETLQVGDNMTISGPIWKVTYHGHGELTFAREEEDGGTLELKIKHFALICGGTGIAPHYQIIKAILDDPTDETKVTLLFLNRSEEDILLKPELEAAAKDPRIKVHYAVDKGTESWKGFTGFVSKEMVEKTMPAPSEAEDTFMWVCGNKPMNKHCRNLLQEMGYSRAKNRF